MFIAFGGLMLSQAKALVQFGLLLAFSVILDTFIIRCALVPAMLALCGSAVWWPSAMPEATKEVDDVSDAVLPSDVLVRTMARIEEEPESLGCCPCPWPWAWSEARADART
mmetsp:Transcript_64197/g.114458  ORF Transcript_64197/g.114458 Transcript_64197/m.114458 type:complete len:111 (-) Transcript_64197:121-453(-)